MKEEAQERALVGQLLAEQAACLVAPAARNVAHRVAAASQHEHGDAKAGQELHAGCVALQAQVEAAQAVP